MVRCKLEYMIFWYRILASIMFNYHSNFSTFPYVALYRESEFTSLIVLYIKGHEYALCCIVGNLNLPP